MLLTNILLAVAAVALFAMAVFASMFYSAVEELSHSEYDEIKNTGTTAATRVVKLLENEERTLSSLELATLTFQGFALFILLLIAYLNLPEVWPWYAKLILVAGIFVYLLIAAVFVCWLPRYYAKEKESGIVSKHAVAIQFLAWLFKPFGTLSVWMKSRFNTTNNTNALSGDEMSDVIEIAEGGEDVETEAQMLKGIVRFGDLVVNEIMKSRVDIVAVEIEESLDNVLALFESTGFSRIPVYEGSMDNIKGILYVKDLLSVMANDKKKSWTSQIRAPFFVPETKSVSDLLHEFQTLKKHIAIVVDEYGGTSGLVTLEDIIEEIVGEITDEYDKAEVSYRKLSDNTFTFEAKTSIIDFCKIMDLSDEEFDEVRGDAETLAGLILEVVGEIPKVGDNVKIKNFTFNIQKADNRRIEQVKVIIENPSEDED